MRDSKIFNSHELEIHGQQQLPIQYCNQIIDILLSNNKLKQHPEIINQDPHILPNYDDIIKSPMNLRTFKQLLQFGQILNSFDFKAKLDLIWDNVIKYFGDNHQISQTAFGLKQVINAIWSTCTIVNGTFSDLLCNLNAKDVETPQTVQDRIMDLNLHNINELGQSLSKEIRSRSSTPFLPYRSHKSEAFRKTLEYVCIFSNEPINCQSKIVISLRDSIIHISETNFIHNHPIFQFSTPGRYKKSPDDRLKIQTMSQEGLSASDIRNRTQINPEASVFYESRCPILKQKKSVSERNELYEKTLK
jgi:hypothetical protein